MSFIPHVILKKMDEPPLDLPFGKPLSKGDTEHVGSGKLSKTTLNQCIATTAKGAAVQSKESNGYDSGLSR